MNVKPIYNVNIISVPKDSVLPILPDCDSSCLRVLLFVLANPTFDDSEICDYLNITRKTLDSSLAFLKENGIIECESISKTVNSKKVKVLKPSSELPSYTADDIAAFCENNPRFQTLLQSCQQIYGKMFNTAETEVVICLVDYLKLEDDYILLLFSHCKRMGKTSLRYIEKLAVGLYDDGILAYDELDTYLNHLEESHKLETQIKKMFGIGHRKLTGKESEAFENWTFKFGFSLEIIEKAYELTVENTGNASVPYCNGILKNWKDKGFSSLDQIEEAIEQYKHDKENAKDTKGSFETDDFFEAALKRSYNDKT